MSYNWVIGIPAWGRAYISTLLRVTLPSVKAALGERNARFVIVTDDPPFVSTWFVKHLPHADVKYIHPSSRSFPGDLGKERYARLGDASRTILDQIRIGEAATLLMADMAVSCDWFSSAEKYFNQGKSLIVIAGGGRTCDGDPPIGASAAELRKWSWEHRHPWIRQCTWGSGSSRAPTVLFFAKNGTVICRGFHQHSHAAFRKLRPMTFSTITGDAGKGGLAESNFKRDEIAVITSPDEIGFAEMTPRESNWPTGDKLSVEGMIKFARNMTDWDWWLFSHRFYLMGDGDPGDREICEEIMRAH